MDRAIGVADDVKTMLHGADALTAKSVDGGWFPETLADVLTFAMPVVEPSQGVKIARPVVASSF